MNLVDAYDSGSDTEKPQRGLLVAPIAATVNSAPGADQSQRGTLMNPLSFAVNPNPDVSTASIEERALQLQQSKVDYFSRTEKEKNHLSGKVEVWHMNNFNFDEQYHNFTKYGIAMDPNINKLIVVSAPEGGDQGAYNPKKEIRLVDPNDPEYAAKSVFGLHSKEEVQKKKDLAKKRKRFGDASTGEFLGPWASYEGILNS